MHTAYWHGLRLFSNILEVECFIWGKYHHLLGTFENNNRFKGKEWKTICVIVTNFIYLKQAPLTSKIIYELVTNASLSFRNKVSHIRLNKI